MFDGGKLRFQPQNLFYPMDLMKSQNLTTSSGQVSALQVNQDILSFIVSQDSQPFISSDVSIAVPLVPFQNRLVVQFKSLALVNLDTNKTVSTLPPNQSFPSYELSASIYLRQKSYPYTLLSKTPHPKVIMNRQTLEHSEILDLDPEYVQADLASEAELVIDFSDMVQQIFDSERDIRMNQQMQGVWKDAKVQISQIRMATQCPAPINLKDLTKYYKTLSALRTGVLKQDYVKIIEYRTDLQSEERVGTLSIVLPVSIVIFIVVIVGCVWKIRQYNRSIIETKKEIEA